MTTAASVYTASLATTRETIRHQQSLCPILDLEWKLSSDGKYFNDLRVRNRGLGPARGITLSLAAEYQTLIQSTYTYERREVRFTMTKALLTASEDWAFNMFEALRYNKEVGIYFPIDSFRIIQCHLTYEDIFGHPYRTRVEDIGRSISHWEPPSEIFPTRKVGLDDWTRNWFEV